MRARAASTSASSSSAWPGSWPPSEPPATRKERPREHRRHARLGAPTPRSSPASWLANPCARWGLIAFGGLVILSLLRVVTGANDLDSSGAIAAAFGLAVPIALAGLGGLWSERAGVVNIGLEGMMILGTWSSAFCAYHYGPWMGILGGAIGGLVGGLIHAIATVYFGVDHIVSGVALNIIGLGIAKYLASRFFTDLPGGGPTQSPAAAAATLAVRARHR